MQGVLALKCTYMIIVPEIYHESTYININVVIIFPVAGTYLEKELPEVGAARSLHPSGYNVFFNEFTDGDDKVSTMLLIFNVKWLFFPTKCKMYRQQ